ncbi:MAG: hypothetical protein LKF49_09045 [Bifidobacterium tibiigranuli]|uniref:hypothetical protein n=1 Tax=Bifidobacterium tibiigranuli TaxID=2172043 RepID=UPI002353E80F|nr:hypothetical protein [Bifidobacterium tibiigranuli]MCH4189511.1 hypothetical protein [Bifidobacterium tibiigranuli]MCH4204333.1 hypothetical protein [Bifidobacterium tibiigranuli]MCH4275380.1 hypothetical protein [Bifidobacterium tibiigranuli]MCI1791585.1 hypothetical protein [Bifidobacterium tibiigranuli]MCI1797326.1 hypothetical protein [Bifidobacterium tibiigranuli]
MKSLISAIMVVSLASFGAVSPAPVATSTPADTGSKASTLYISCHAALWWWPWCPIR